MLLKYIKKLLILETSLDARPCVLKQHFTQSNKQHHTDLPKKSVDQHDPNV